MKIGGRHLWRRRRGRDNRQSPDLRIGIVRGCGQRLRIDRDRRGQRFERQAADARTRHGFAFRQKHQPPRERQRALARSAQLLLGPGEAFEAERDAETIGGASLSSGQLDQRLLCGVDLGGVDVRKPADRVADGLADIGLRFHFEPRGERRRHAVERRRGRRLVAFPALRGLSDRVGRLGSDLRQRVAQGRQDIGDERRPLEAAKRADGGANRLRVAVQAGSDDGQIARRRRAAVFGLQHGQPRSSARAAGSSWARGNG